MNYTEYLIAIGKEFKGKKIVTPEGKEKEIKVIIPQIELYYLDKQEYPAIVIQKIGEKKIPWAYNEAVVERTDTAGIVREPITKIELMIQIDTYAKHIYTHRKLNEIVKDRFFMGDKPLIVEEKEYFAVITNIADYINIAKNIFRTAFTLIIRGEVIRGREEELAHQGIIIKEEV